MRDDELEPGQAALFDALRRRKTECPSEDAIVAYYLEEADPGDRAGIEDHLTLCSFCSELLDRLKESGGADEEAASQAIEERLLARAAPWKQSARSQSVRRPGFRRHWMAAAAVLVVALGATMLWQIMIREATPPGPPEGVRGELIQAHEPRGETGALRDFRWTSYPVASRFRLEIRRGDRVIWQTDVEESRYRPGPDLLQLLAPRERFEWRVVGLNEDGVVVAESLWTAFEYSP